MKITIEKIKAIGFEKHGLFTKESFIYQKELGQSYEIRIKFKTIQLNGDYVKYIPTEEYVIYLFSGDEFDKGYKLPLSINSIGKLKSFLNAFDC